MDVLELLCCFTVTMGYEYLSVPQHVALDVVESANYVPCPETGPRREVEMLPDDGSDGRIWEINRRISMTTERIWISRLVLSGQFQGVPPREHSYRRSAGECKYPLLLSVCQWRLVSSSPPAQKLPLTVEGLRKGSDVALK